MLNRWNAFCLSEQTGYDWDSTFGICIDRILEYIGLFINGALRIHHVEPLDV
jgi:hypothetical protein